MRSLRAISSPMSTRRWNNSSARAFSPLFQAGEITYGRSSLLWLGGYRILDRLGKGAMGAVFLAEHSVLGRRVAVKVLSESLRADPGARKRFSAATRAAASLDHPNIVRVFDVNMNNEPPYLVMEYVDGEAFRPPCRSSVRLPPAKRRRWERRSPTAWFKRQWWDWFTATSPANLLVDRRGSAKILDLGIVRFTHEETFSRLHGSEVILGTLDYLAPEQRKTVRRSIHVPTFTVSARRSTSYWPGIRPTPSPTRREKLDGKADVRPAADSRVAPDVPAGIRGGHRETDGAQPGGPVPNAGRGSGGVAPVVRARSRLPRPGCSALSSTAPITADG